LKGSGGGKLRLHLAFGSDAAQAGTGNNVLKFGIGVQAPINPWIGLR
jgi:hypothetical protein